MPSSRIFQRLAQAGRELGAELTALTDAVGRVDVIIDLEIVALSSRTVGRWALLDSDRSKIVGVRFHLAIVQRRSVLLRLRLQHCISFIGGLRVAFACGSCAQPLIERLLSDRWCRTKSLHLWSIDCGVVLLGSTLGERLDHILIVASFLRTIRRCRLYRRLVCLCGKDGLNPHFGHFCCHGRIGCCSSIGRCRIGR